MKAVAVFPTTRQVELIEIAPPRIKAATQVKLRMLDIGVCGTDREICSFQYGTPPAGEDHLVLGHESLGEVVEVGTAVTSFSVGDLVVPMVRRPCRHEHCLACRSDRQDFCCTNDYTERGIKEAHGFMAEIVVEEEKYLVPVPRDLRDVAVLVEPLTIAEKAFAQGRQIMQRLPWVAHAEKSNLRRGRKAVVLGAGPVGLLAALAFVIRELDTFVYSRDPEHGLKAELLRSIGATHISSDTTSIADFVERLGNIDFVYEAAGASGVSFELLQHLGPNGVFCFTGVPGRKAPISVDTDLLMRNLVLKNQVVFGTVNAGRDAFEDAVRDLSNFHERWPQAVRSLITARHPIEGHAELLLGHHAGIKSVVTFS